MAFTQPLPAALSPSRLSDFQTCPRRYQYASVERLPQPSTYATAKGRFVHYIFEHLFLLEPTERTVENARSFVEAATEEILTPDVREEIPLNEDKLATLVREADEIVSRYFQMEDPSHVTSEGVELRFGVTVEGAPLLGIVDRLDREENGELTIVDYKTGKVPDRRYDAQTFANTELYAALCAAERGEQPTYIRLLYVAHGTSLERPVSDIVVRARARAAADAWGKITRYYDDGDFPATPSPRACRFCSFRDVCRARGVPVAVG